MLVAPLDASLAFTCAALPGLIRSTTWDAVIGDAREENGLSGRSRGDDGRRRRGILGSKS
jgi:hypothetical protein